MGHPPRIPVWIRSEQPVIYFITLCVAGRKKVIANKEALTALTIVAQKNENWKMLAAVLMPDHLHAIVTPTNDRAANLSSYIGGLKRWIRRELGAKWRWQPGCFDRLLRNDESAYDKWLYMKENPVRAGLVKHSEDWPYRIGFAGEAGG
jgi:putative transposase